MTRALQRLALVSAQGVAATELRLAQETVLDMARRLRAAGWQVNVAFESGDDGERFTLSGSHAS